MKYKLTKNKKTIGEITLYQIEALRLLRYKKRRSWRLDREGE